MPIRPYRPDDAASLGVLFFESVREVGRRAYSQAQVEAWAPGPWSAESIAAKAADGRLWLVAADAADRPIGFGNLERDGHVDHLFCHPSVVGTGVGSALYLALEAAAQTWKLTRLFTEASELARPMFERHGFEVIERRDFDLRGVEIHHYRMDKRL